MGLVIEAPTSKVKSKARVTLLGATDLLTEETSLTTIFRVKEFIYGLTEGGSKEIGLTIRCMARECSHGLIKELMRESTLMIKSRARVSSPGQMAEFIGEDGTMGNSMVSENTGLQREYRGLESGRMERDLNGLPQMGRK